MLEELQQLKNEKRLVELNAKIPYAEFLGLEVKEDENGILTILKANPDNLGNVLLGAIHGGTVATVMEHAASFHLLHELDCERIPRLVNCSIDYLRRGLNKDTFARGEVIKQGRRVANVRVTAWQDDPAKPIACAHAHFLIA